MNLLENKDDFFQLNNTEKNIFQKKRASNKSVKNKLKANFESPTNTNRLKKLHSISESPIQNRQNINKSNGNILNDYLHSHKFVIQRKKTRKKTHKVQNNDNHLILNMDKSYLSNKENLTMIYSQNQKKIKQKKAKGLNENENLNLKKIENSLILKLR